MEPSIFKPMKELQSEMRQAFEEYNLEIKRRTKEINILTWNSNLIV